jgi:hypothetical protein
MSQASSSDTVPASPLDQTISMQQVSSTRLAGLLRIWQRLPQRLIFCVLVFCAALFFNLRHLGRPSIWFDEAFSVELARQPLPLLWHIIFFQEPNMEL